MYRQIEHYIMFRNNMIRDFIKVAIISLRRSILFYIVIVVIIIIIIASF